MLRLLGKRSLRRCASLVSHVRLLTHSPPQPRLIQEARAQWTEKTINVTWRDGTTNRYPLVYLRDNCQCLSCYDPNLKARLSDVMSYCDLKYDGTKVSVSEDNVQLGIRWPDNHVSTFRADWLQERRFPESREPTKSIIPNHVALWGNDKRGTIPQMNFEEILLDNDGVCKWSDLLRKYGFVFMTDIPIEPGQLTRLAERVAGYIRSTISGSVFEIVVNPDSFGLPFTDKMVAPHLDQPFLDNPSDVLLLRCLKQSSEGGETVLADGFNVAAQIYKADPKAFQSLTQSCLPYRYMEESPSGKAMVESEKVPIRLDHAGKLRQISYNEHSRATKYFMSVKEVEEFYNAHFMLTKLIRDPANILTLKMQPGQGFALDNRRIIHGRKAFDMTAGVRSVEGCYLDWDAINSKKRYIKKDQQNQEQDVAVMQ